jgi:hypothetical protein
MGMVSYIFEDEDEDEDEVGDVETYDYLIYFALTTEFTLALLSLRSSTQQAFAFGDVLNSLV